MHAHTFLVEQQVNEDQPSADSCSCRSGLKQALAGLSLLVQVTDGQRVVQVSLCGVYAPCKELFTHDL